jgi:acyl transferase domain-containing protein/NADPH:quinone reductase-like Zn-dependent oxidoreductase/NAD(P)-dependent dehydrogenase (short-subunit alcohol dehydrogenase family)/acyl carrier protein
MNSGFFNGKSPIAIVGMGCRFPGGASNSQKFWENLINKVDAIVDVPADRWDERRFYDSDPNRPGKTKARQAGFITENIKAFDPMFFGISPREAAPMDPQQRLLLETTWEVFEDAGILPDAYRGKEVGVFIGGFTLDNKLIQLGELNRDIIGGQTATSSTMVMLSNRISYTFDFRGPSLTIDTACSSSLVATHYACQSIWQGESKMAIAGGVNVMLNPGYPITMSKGQFLSDHSRCKAFDEDARGYVRGEGAGVILLKPLEDALSDNDFIYALIRGTGVNQDGKTNGITVPNGEAQIDLVKKVCESAGVKPGEISYVEAHGTGTQAGDPVEFGGLSKVLSEGREPSQKCWIGSVKTNIGHLEAGAGIAGLIKTALVLHHKKVPPHLHFNRPNPKIDLENSPFEIPLKTIPLSGDNLYASVNSFGYGGTNAHVIVEDYRNDATHSIPSTTSSAPYLLPLSAKSKASLIGSAGKLYELLDGEVGNKPSVEDLVYTSIHHRTHHTFRAAITFWDRNDLKDKLKLMSSGKMESQIPIQKAKDDKKILFVYTGMGPQWWGMGKTLRETFPYFRERMNHYDQAFQKVSGFSILDQMLKGENASQIHETQYAQPANFVLQACLTDLLSSWGLKPDAVLGHSVGEVTASYVAGVLNLEDAMRVSFHRSRIQKMAAGLGNMLAVGLSEKESLQWVNRCNLKKVSLGAVNSFSSVTLSGELGDLQLLSQELTKENIFNRLLNVEVAYHSFQMEPFQEEILRALKDISPNKAHLPIYSTVTTKVLEGKEMHAGYWWENVRKPVRFAEAFQHALANALNIQLEVGPHPVLRSSILESHERFKPESKTFASLRRGENELESIFNLVGNLYSMGFSPDWRAFSPYGRLVKLPTYSWDREELWHETLRSQEERLGRDGHVFMNNDMRTPEPSWEVEINGHFFPWLQDHQIETMVVVPGAAYVEAGLAVHRNVYGESVSFSMENLHFHNMLSLDNHKVQMLHLTFSTGNQEFKVLSRLRGDEPNWKLHASGKIIEKCLVENPQQLIRKELLKRCDEEVDLHLHYEKLALRGLHYGPWFRWLKTLKKGKDFLYATIKNNSPSPTQKDSYILHPSVMDASFQALLALAEGEDWDADVPFVPVHIEKIHFFSKPHDSTEIFAELLECTPNQLSGNITYFGEDGKIHVILEKVVCQAVGASIGHLSERDVFYGFDWEEIQLQKEESPFTKALLLGDESKFSTSLLNRLQDNGYDLTFVCKGDKFESGPNKFVMDWQYPDHYMDLLKKVGKKVDLVINLWSMNQEFGLDFHQTMAQTLSYSYLIKSLANQQPNHPCRVIQVTVASQVIDEEDSVISTTVFPLSGLIYLVGNEFSFLSTRLIDLEDTGLQHINALLKEMHSNTPIAEVAIRNGKRFEKKLVRLSPEAFQKVISINSLSSEQPVSLCIGQVGNIESLFYQAEEINPLQPDEIRLQVYSAALNFKDLLKVFGNISPKALEGTYFKNALGMEVCGEVVEVGGNVKNIKIGEKIVMATRDGGFKSMLTARPEFFIPLSSKLDYKESLTLVPYLTALFGIRDKAYLQPGEKILIHNASGGVGLAAIQVAKWIGAEIYATAGSPEKREYLSSLGIQHVFNSRNLEYVSLIRKITNGYGVDVVINAIAGESLQQSFSLLAPYGRFIEIGKKDIAENKGLPMAAFNRGCSFMAVDIDRMFLERGEVIRKLLSEIHELFEKGIFSAYPIQVFPANEADKAFAFLAQSRHLGKVVLDFKDQVIEVKQHEAVNLDPDAVYLISGGTGGFGLELAKWLANKGAKNLMLISRNGPKTSKEIKEIEALGNRGVNVMVEACDISHYDEVKEAIAYIRAQGKPLKGIIHGAMVLDDGTLAELTKSRFEKVMLPKVKGAIHLHNATLEMDLDFFVCLSSISSIIGNFGQGNYVAANAFLDGFSRFRRSMGKHAITLNLGVLTDTGVVARDGKGLAQLFDHSGVRGLSSKELINYFDKAITKDYAQIGLFEVDWERWFSSNPSNKKWPKYAGLFNDTGNKVRGVEFSKLQEEIKALPKKEFYLLLQEKLKGFLSLVLKIPKEKVEMNKGVNFLGLDSILAVEFRRQLQLQYGLEISTMELLSGISLNDIADKLLEDLSSSPQEGDGELDGLTEEEIDALLLKELEGKS